MGMRKLYFGLESADQRTMDHMIKGTKVENVRPVLANCRDAAIDVHLFSIIGFPEEDEASARNTFQFFLDNRDVIERPGTSFDIHPFGLELRTDYFREHEKLGIRLTQNATSRDFPIGIAAEDWNNTRGISAADVNRLLDEFYPGLKSTFRRWHNVPYHLWPGFEEYAVLYAAHWDGKPFPFATSIADLAIDTAFRLNWKHPVATGERDGRIRITNAERTVEISAFVFHTLDQSRIWTKLDLAVALTGAVEHMDNVVQSIDALIGVGLLQLALETTDTSLSSPELVHEHAGHPSAV